MAITIKQAPDRFQPAYNPIVTVVSSDKTAQDNFLYVCDIYITGVSSPAYIRKKLNADPTTGYAAFDVHRIIENYVTSDIDTSTYGFQKNSNGYVEYQCSFGEEFGSSSTGTTVYSNLTSGTINWAWNGVLDYTDWVEFTTDVLAGDNNYVLEQGNTFLNNSPASLSIRDSQYAWLNAQTNTSGTIYFAEVKTYNTAGALIQTVKVRNPYQALTTNDMKFVRFGCGTLNLNQINVTYIYSGSLPIITASVASYTVRITDFFGNAKSDLKTFNIENDCTNYTVFPIHFLNKLGGFDFFNFIKISRSTSAINRQSYKKNVGTLASSANYYTYNYYDRSDANFDVNIKDTITVNSDWISEAQSTWLEELITSPTVFTYDTALGALVAINITNTSYEKRKVANDKIFNLILTFEYSYNRKRQRG